MDYLHRKLSFLLKNNTPQSKPIQLIPNGDFADTSFWAFKRAEFVSVSDSVATIRATQAVSTVNVISVRLCAPIDYVTGHQYYIGVSYKRTNGDARCYAQFALNDAGKGATLSLDATANQWIRAEGIINPINDGVGDTYRTGLWLGLKGNVANNVDDLYYVKDFMCVDLTRMYGAGNEPTAQQFKSLYPNDYYPYYNPA